MTSLHHCTKCGLPLTFTHPNQILYCRGCSTANARPQSTGSFLDVLQRAHRLRIDKDYVTALDCYNHVLHQHPDEHDALWGRLLSLYGVAYERDTSTGKQKLLVHFPHTVPFSEQSDFRAACEKAPQEVRVQYEADARYIDDVQQSILSKAQTEKPYDIFLCFKDTVSNSIKKTEDYFLANRLCLKLEEMGYRAFFSPREIPQQQGGANYEAAIYHALDTAPVMIVVGTCREHMMATWPQSEWSRFLEWFDGKHGPRTKRLIPVYQDMTREELPEAFTNRSLEDFDLSNPHAEGDLLYSVQTFFRQLHPQDTVMDAVLREQVATLTRERDEAMAKLHRISGPNDLLRQLLNAETERDDALVRLQSTQIELDDIRAQLKTIKAACDAARLKLTGTEDKLEDTRLQLIAMETERDEVRLQCQEAEKTRDNALQLLAAMTKSRR